MVRIHSYTNHLPQFSQEHVRGWLADVEAADDPALHAAVGRLSYLAAAVGLIDDSDAVELGDWRPSSTVRAAAPALIALGQAGIAVEPMARMLDASPAAGAASQLVNAVREVIEHNPLPDYEWPAVRAVLDDETLAQLLGISTQSIRRYGNGERAVPDEVAARLHFVALVNGDLIGSYNERGIRRWWRRPRAALDGRSPLDALVGGWDPDRTPAAAQIRRLAAGLAGAGAAT